MTTMTRIIYSFLYIIIFIVFTITCEAAAKSISVEELLNKQEVIRIVTDGADGLGNQAASANIVVRLRQMGYKGKFEFIYPDYAMDKIAILFDLPNKLSDRYFDQQANIEFIKLKSFFALLQRHEITLTTLGMTGVVVGNICQLAGTDNSDETTCNNFAKMTNTRFFIRMSPFISSEIKDWPSKTDTKIYTQDQAKPSVQLNSDNKFIVMPVANLNDAKFYLANDPRGRELAATKPVLPMLIDAIEQRNINVLPVYGYHIQIRKSCDKNNTNNCLFTRMNEIMQIITGARHAQLSGIDNFDKPLVIPVFYDYKKEAAFLNQLITGNIWDSISEPGADSVKAIIKSLNLSTNFFIASADDADAIQKIEQLKKNQILILSMGPLPKIVFDGLYTHTSENTWPQIREGANTLNSLLLTGKPHLRCADDGWEMGFNRIDDENLRDWLINFYNSDHGFCNNTQILNDDMLAKQVGQFIIDAHDPASPLSAYFSKLKTDSLKPENDRIHYALEEVAKNVNSRA